MEAGGNLLQTVRQGLLRAFNVLPMLIIVFIGFMAVSLGNISLFMLFAGHSLLVPLAVGILQAIGNAVIGRSPQWDQLLRVDSTDVSRLVPSAPSADLTGRVNVAPSYWMAHITFFFVYIMTNAIKVNTIPRDYKLSKWLYENRKSKTITVAVLSAFLLVTLTVVRYMLTGAETLSGITIAYVTMGLLGWGWFEFAKRCGARNGDLLSITQQIIPAAAKDQKPMMCVYTAKP